jgi:hypothetical protein
MIRRKFEMADRLEILLGTNKKPQRLIWGDVIAWLLVLVLALCVPFVMFFVAISMGFKKIFGTRTAIIPGQDTIGPAN